MRALKKQTCYIMHLMGKLKGTWLNQIKLHLRATHRFNDLKKITQVVTNYVYCNISHSRLVGLEGEERFGSCKKKLNTMISSLQDSHRPNKMKISMPQQLKSTMVQENIVLEFPKSLMQPSIPLKLCNHGWKALDILETTCNQDVFHIARMITN